jgi:HK97 family phage prohead protease
MVAPLYEDVEPVRICGFASVFDVTYELGGMLERIEPGAFDTTRFEVFACFDHDDRHRLAWTRDRSLKLWQDVHGLAFEATAPSNWSALSLLEGIRGGVFRACSFRCGDVDAIKSEVVVERGQPVRVIKRITVDEVSVCPIGANPETTCWLSTEDPEALPPHVRHARAQWYKGRLQVQLAARAARAARAQARARTTNKAHKVPESVRHILAHGKPKGWAEAAEALARELRR